MLKKRVIVGLTFFDGILTRTKQFRSDYRYTSRFVGQGAADEVFLIDVSSTDRQGAAFWNGVAPYIDRCFCPITIGGGIESEFQIERAFKSGADKVLLGPSKWLGWIPKRWGAQAMTMGISGDDPAEAAKLAKTLEDQGAGEILLQSIKRDGSLGGYDLDLLRAVNEACGLPVVIGGGCGGWRHMQEGFGAGASGCLTTVIHHFTDSQLSAMKGNLGNAGVLVRPA